MLWEIVKYNKTNKITRLYYNYNHSLSLFFFYNSFLEATFSHSILIYHKTWSANNRHVICCCCPTSRCCISFFFLIFYVLFRCSTSNIIYLLPCREYSNNNNINSNKQYKKMLKNKYKKMNIIQCTTISTV